MHEYLNTRYKMIPEDRISTTPKKILHSLYKPPKDGDTMTNHWIPLH